MSQCNWCERELDVAEEPLSNDCGGECWRCISLVEADGMGIPIDHYRALVERGVDWQTLAEISNLYAETFT